MLTLLGLVLALIPIPCPADDAPGYLLTDVYADGSFRCEHG